MKFMLRIEISREAGEVSSEMFNTGVKIFLPFKSFKKLYETFVFDIWNNWRIILRNIISVEKEIQRKLATIRKNVRVVEPVA